MSIGASWQCLVRKNKLGKRKDPVSIYVISAVSMIVPPCSSLTISRHVCHPAFAELLQILVKKLLSVIRCHLKKALHLPLLLVQASTNDVMVTKATRLSARRRQQSRKQMPKTTTMRHRLMPRTTRLRPQQMLSSPVQMIMPLLKKIIF